MKNNITDGEQSFDQGEGGANTSMTFTAKLLVNTGLGSRTTPTNAATEPSIMLLDKPAPLNNWEEALPVGNGRLGAMVFGGVKKDRLQLNEGTIWSGSPKNFNRMGASRFIPEVRKLIYEGKHQQAKALVRNEILGERPTGAYHPLGDLSLYFSGVDNPVDYRRELDLETAVVRISFRDGDALFTREVFASAPDQVIVVRLTCNQPARLSFTAKLSREVDGDSASIGDRGLALRGQPDRDRPTAGTSFIGRLEARLEGGSVSSKDGVLKVEKADAVTLFFNAASSYRSEDFERQCESQLTAAMARAFEEIRAAHVLDYQTLFRRMSLYLGQAPALPMDERLRRFKKGAQDNALIALFVQYGRYLLISSSRPNSHLPANLQGIWNHRYTNQPWFSGWHFNISAPMNYWMAETANLSECHTPFINFVNALRVNGRQTAREVYGSSGFVVAHRTNADLFTAPVSGLTIWVSGAGWACQHLWEHYLFTQDQDYLRNTGYPIMKEAAEFFLGWLSPAPLTGLLVSGPSQSPENSFMIDETNFADLDMGPAMDQQIAAELFDNCLSAAAVLGINDEFVVAVKKSRVQLASGTQIGSDGRLLEWSTERPEHELGHRHLSHLYAFYPGAQISLRKNPELSAAVRQSLEFRLQHGNARDGALAADSGNTGWSLAWSANIWARLGDGQKALQAVHRMISDLLFPNLMCTAPWETPGDYPHIIEEGTNHHEALVYQIDGQLGMPAAIIEMLLQSHAGEIELLPALPEEWSQGQVKGLKARGAFEVDITWSSGRLARATIHAARGGACRVRFGERVAEFSTHAGEVLALDSELGRLGT